MIIVDFVFPVPVTEDGSHIVEGFPVAELPDLIGGSAERFILYIMAAGDRLAGNFGHLAKREGLKISGFKLRTDHGPLPLRDRWCFIEGIVRNTTEVELMLHNTGEDKWRLLLGDMDRNFWDHVVTVSRFAEFTTTYAEGTDHIVNRLGAVIR